MSVENVKAFFKRLEEDEVFRAVLLKIEPQDEEGFFKTATEAGYPFTMDELKQTQEELKGVELSPEQLEKVAGGVEAGSCFYYGIGSIYFMEIINGLNGNNLP